MARVQKASLSVRAAQAKDIDGIFDLVKKVYDGWAPYPKAMIAGQINNYPEGHFVALIGGVIVGYCASIRLDEKKALSAHNWREITGNGYGSTHVENGDYLYGYEVCVDPQYRGHKIGERFYRARKNLCRYHRLKGIAFVGRIPNLHKRIKELGSAEKYVEAVKAKKVRDPVLAFQLRQGFEILGIFADYLPSDKESMGYGVHLAWKNPSYVTPTSKTSRLGSNVVRVATVQYGQRKIKSKEEFSQMVEFFVDTVADYKCDFVCFPELFTLQLLSLENKPGRPDKAVREVAKYTPWIRKLFNRLAVKYNINIIGGSHPSEINGEMYNIAYICLRDGSIHEQAKIHPTPNEKYWWNMRGGNEVLAINTDCGPIGVLVCYDCEFPELARHLVDQGINILFVPYLTDERQSYCRVRYCAQARAVENQIYVVLSGNVGNLPNVHNMDIHYAQSAILTPCDFPFARDGIAADTTPNVETVALADLRIDALVEARSSGTVRNLQDRRHDLYTVKWFTDDK